ncbi:hypothetical protein TGRH88_078430 [Toxoplasma gondii]|uniref:Uncharacterized protein n=1 Tax=Toxoplasma gondii TaxID=5811 RepID=A0A7J6K6C9_TOXGO|nr:hypothetical protein TGRH88_078430 [Toxoplasma gondii]
MASRLSLDRRRRASSGLWSSSLSLFLRSVALHAVRRTTRRASGDAVQSRQRTQSSVGEARAVARPAESKTCSGKKMQELAAMGLVRERDTPKRRRENTASRQAARNRRDSKGENRKAMMTRECRFQMNREEIRSDRQEG